MTVNCNTHTSINGICIYCYAQELEKEVFKLQSTLKDLYKLKKYKKDIGKDDHYHSHSKLIWNKVKELLKDDKEFGNGCDVGSASRPQT